MTDDEWVAGYKNWVVGKDIFVSNAANPPGSYGSNNNKISSYTCVKCNISTFDVSQLVLTLTGWLCRPCDSRIFSNSANSPVSVGNKKACTCGGTVRVWNIAKSSYECSSCGKLDSVSPSPWSIAMDEALEELNKIYKPDGRTDAPYRPIRNCTCGSDKTYGPNSLTHSSWCDLGNG